MRVHGVYQGVIPSLRGLQHYGPAVQEVVILGDLALDNGRRLARLLIRGRKGAVLGNPVRREESNVSE